MLTNFRRLLIDAMIYGGGDFLLRATAFITLPIYTRIFSPENYGIWSYLNTLSSLFITLVSLGGASVANRFFFDAKALQQKQAVVSTWLIFLALWTTSVTLLLTPWTDIISVWAFDTAAHSTLVKLSLVAVPLTLVNLLCGQLLRDQFQPRLFTLLNFISTLLTIVLSLLGVIVLRWGLVGLAAGNLLAVCLMLPVRLWTARQMLRPVFSLRLLRQMLIFGAPLVPMSIAYWVFSVSDTVLLGKLSTFEQVGLYSVASKLTLALGLANSALGQAWVPHALHLYETQPDMASVFFGRVLTYILVGFSTAGIVVIVFTPELLLVLASSRFAAAAPAVAPLVFATIALASTQVTALSMSLTKRTYYLTIFSMIAAVLNVGLNLLLLPRWGMIAAAWTTALAYLFLTVAYLVVAQRLWSVSYEWTKLIALSLLTFVFGMAAGWLPDAPMLNALFLKIAFCALYLTSLFLFQVIGKHEIEAVRVLWRQMYARLAHSST